MKTQIQKQQESYQKFQQALSDCRESGITIAAYIIKVESQVESKFNMANVVSPD